MKRIATAIEALYRGRQLANVETWKNAGVATAALSGLLSLVSGIAVSQGWLDAVPDELIMGVSSGVVTLVSAVLAYLQVATTEKIGVRPRDDAGASGVRRDELPPGGEPEYRDSRGGFSD